MAMDKMEKFVQDSLQEGETILWSGQTEKFSLTGGQDGKKVLRKMLISAVVVGGLMAVYVTRVESVKGNLLAIMGVVLAVLLLAPIMEWSGLQKQRYWLTNQRAIMVKGSLAAFSLPLKNLDDYTIISMENGGDCLVLGSKVVAEGSKQLRWRAAHPLEDSQSAGKIINGMVFYNIKNASSAVSILEGALAA